MIVAVLIVVEDLVLRGYYNSLLTLLMSAVVVEDLVLRGYYNSAFCFFLKALL